VIVRSWSARIDASNMAKYLAHLDRSVKPALAALDGFVDAMVLERSVEGAVATAREVVVQTRWRSLDAVRAFAGADISVAVVEPAAAALFTDYDRHVLHYDVVG
jgi:heme-degrading monooxygenase HmoA